MEVKVEVEVEVKVESGGGSCCAKLTRGRDVKRQQH